MARSKTAARQSAALHRHKQRGGHLYYDRRLAAVKDLVAKPELPKSKHHSYFEFAENTDKKKKIEFEVTNKKEPSTNFTFVPIGNPELTSACKELSREKGALIYIVSTTKEKNLNLGEHVHRIGYHFRTAIVEEATSQLGDNQIAQGTNPSDIEDGDTDKIPGTQEEINKQADAAIRDLFPRIPNTDREMVIQHAFQKGAVFNGKPVVGLQEELSLSRRVQLAVIAHIRHTHTRYDLLLRETTWENARRAVESLCLDILVKWRGDEETGRDQLDEVLREIVVISDSENDDDSDEGNDEEEDETESDDDVQEVPGPTVSEVMFRALTPAGETLTSRKRKRLQRPDRDNPNLTIVDTRSPPRQHVKQHTKMKRKMKKLARKSRRGFKRYEAWQEAVKRRQGEPETGDQSTTDKQTARGNGRYQTIEASTSGAATEVRSSDHPNMLVRGVEKYGRDLRPALVSGSHLHASATHISPNAFRNQAELPQTRSPEKQVIPEHVAYRVPTLRRAQPEDEYGSRRDFMDLTSPQQPARYLMRPQIVEEPRLAEQDNTRQRARVEQDMPLPSVEPMPEAPSRNPVVFSHHDRHDQLGRHDYMYIGTSEVDGRHSLSPHPGVEYADADALRSQFREPYTRVVAESSRSQLGGTRLRSHLQYLSLPAPGLPQSSLQHDRPVREIHPRFYLEDERLRYTNVPAPGIYDASHRPAGSLRRVIEQDPSMSGLNLERMRVSDQHQPHQMVSAVRDGVKYPQSTLVPPSLHTPRHHTTQLYLEPRTERPRRNGSLLQYSLPVGYREQAVPDEFHSLSSASDHLNSHPQISNRSSDRSFARQHIPQYVSNENVDPNLRHIDVEAMDVNRTRLRADRELVISSLGRDVAQPVGYARDHAKAQIRYVSRPENVVVREQPRQRVMYESDQLEPPKRAQRLPVRDEVIVLD